MGGFVAVYLSKMAATMVGPIPIAAQNLLFSNVSAIAL